MKIHDQHVHSYYSFDSKQSIDELLNKASELGLDYFVLTDHCDLNYLDGNKDIFFDVKKQHLELEELEKKHPHIKILKGIEVGYKPNERKRIDNIIKTGQFDLINLSLHESDKIDYYHYQDFLRLGVRETLELYFSRQYEAVRDFDDFDVLCHIDYGFKTAYLNDRFISINKYESFLIKIMEELIKKNKALEINIKVQEELPSSHTIYLLNLYYKLGGKYITLSSDAHEVGRFRENFEKYIALIKQSGFKYLTYFVNREKHLFEI